MSEILEQYFPPNVLGVTDVGTALADLGMTLAMCGRGSNKAALNNEWLDVRTIGCFVFYVIDFGKMPEGGKLPFKPRRNIAGASEGGRFIIFTDGSFSGDLSGMGYAFSFEDRGAGR